MYCGPDPEPPEGDYWDGYDDDDERDTWTTRGTPAHAAGTGGTMKPIMSIKITTTISLQNAITQLVAFWFIEQCNDPAAPFFLYHIPSSGPEGGVLTIAQEKPDDRWELSSPARISPAWERSRAVRFIEMIGKNLPILSRN